MGERESWRDSDRCPSRAQLAAFNVGNMSGQILHTIAEHIEGCRRCLAMLDELDQTPDWVIEKLRKTLPTGVKFAASFDAGSPTHGPSLHTKLEDGRPLPREWPVIPGYQILGRLGHGSMGVVYKARHLALGRPVALKMIREGTGARPTMLARFHLEARAVARLQHPNIIQIFEATEYAGCPFLVLEYVEGGSLEKQLTGTPQPVPQAAQLVQTLARAVHAAHQRGILHRDLKPANVLLTADGTPKISDFGLAKLLGEEANQTQSGMIVGTPSYMAPEQASGRVGPGQKGGKPEMGPAADVYALGAILYELLTGRPPFRAETSLDTVMQVLAQEPVSPSRLNPKVPRDLETICLKCLEKDPRKRYASAETLGEDLQRFLRGKPILARPVSPAERWWRWARRNPSLAATSALASAAVLAVTVFSILLAESQATESKLAREQAEREARERGLAQVRLEKAHKLAESILPFHAQLWNQHGATPAHLKVRLKMLELLEDFVGNPDTEPQSLLLLATAYSQVGDVQGGTWNPNLGDPQSALKSYRKALHFLEQLPPDILERTEHQIFRAKLHSKIGGVYQEIGQLKEARENCFQGRELLETLLPTLRQQDPNHSKVRHALANSYELSGDLQRQEGEVDLAMNSYRKSMEIRVIRTQEDLEDDDAERELAFCHDKIGDLLFEQDQIQEAAVHYERSLTFREPQARKHIHNAMIQRNLARSRMNLGKVHQAQGESERALTLYGAAMETYVELARHDAETFSCQWDVLRCHVAIAQVEETQGHADKAQARYRKAREIGETLARNYPENARIRDELARIAGKLGPAQ